jgi:serine/threonine protein kinase/predicted ATPase
MHPSEGLRFGPYEVLAQLGAGGMGRIYKAKDIRLNRVVAIKVLPEEAIGDRDSIERLLHEARAASALNHPNIVTIYDVGEEAEFCFIVLELIEGHMLREKMMGQLSLNELVKIGRQAARALEVAHAGGIIHCDIKPENIMVRRDGLVKVLDFGLARLATNNPPPMSLPPRRPCQICSPAADEFAATAPLPNMFTGGGGQIYGTVRYMSPEQAQGRPLTGATDIFSLGIVLYEAATGKHPFATDSQTDILQAIAFEQVTTPSRLNPEIPKAFEDLLLKMLDKDPERRPTSTEVGAALEAIGAALEGIGQRRPSRLIGRGDELRQLRAAFESVQSGSGLIVCVSGEPGIGKTTLIEEFLAELAQRDPAPTMARGRCSELLAKAEAYLPILEALNSMPDESARLMEALAPTWRAHVDPVSPKRMKLELATFLQEASRKKPLILFLDDMHWADVSTTDMLYYLAGKLDAMRMLIILAHRPTELLLEKHPLLRIKLELQGRGVLREIPLRFLSRDEVERYMALEFPDNSFPKELPEVIYARTEGNPLFMINMLNYLRDRGIIAQRGGRWVLASPLPDLERDCPESTRSVIWYKIEQLAEEDRQLLIAASAQGYQFDSATMAKSLCLDATQVEERLEAICRVHGLVQRIRESTFPDGTTTLHYNFVHSVYYGAFNALLMPSRKAALSVAIANALIEFYGEHAAAIASKIALLLEAARDRRALEFFLRATENNLRLYAYQEAAQLARRGLALLGALREAPERAELELDLRMTLGLSLMATRGYASPEVEATYALARSLCQKLGKSQKQFQALGGLHAFHLVRAEYDQARELADQMLRLAEGGQDHYQLASAHWAVGVVLDAGGNFGAALDQFKLGFESYDLWRSSSQAGNRAQDPGVLNLCYAARCLHFLGYAERALSMAHEAVAMARKMPDPYMLGFALMISSFIHLKLRDWDRSLEFADEGIRLAREHGFKYLEALATIAQGRAAAEADPNQGIEILRSGMALYDKIGARIGRPQFLTLLAEAMANQGTLQEALAVLAEAIALAHKTGETYYESEMHRLLGELLEARAEDQNPSPQICFQRALEIARQQNARLFELRAAMALARLWQRCGILQKALRLLKGAYDKFSEGFDTEDLKRARSLLEELSREPNPPRSLNQL